jgi:hypothetical protein
MPAAFAAAIRTPTIEANTLLLLTESFRDAGAIAPHVAALIATHEKTNIVNDRVLSCLDAGQLVKDVSVAEAYVTKLKGVDDAAHSKEADPKPPKILPKEAAEYVHSIIGACHGAADRIAGVTPTGGGGGGFNASALSAMGTSFGAAMKGALPSLEDQEISVADDDRLTTEFDNCYGWPLSEEERPDRKTMAKMRRAIKDGKTLWPSEQQVKYTAIKPATGGGDATEARVVTATAGTLQLRDGAETARHVKSVDELLEQYALKLHGIILLKGQEARPPGATPLAAAPCLTAAPP